MGRRNPGVVKIFREYQGHRPAALCQRQLGVGRYSQRSGRPSEVIRPSGLVAQPPATSRRDHEHRRAIPVTGHGRKIRALRFGSASPRHPSVEHGEPSARCVQRQPKMLTAGLLPHPKADTPPHGGNNSTVNTDGRLVDAGHQAVDLPREQGQEHADGDRRDPEDREVERDALLLEQVDQLSADRVAHRDRKEPQRQ